MLTLAVWTLGACIPPDHERVVNNSCTTEDCTPDSECEHICRGTCCTPRMGTSCAQRTRMLPPTEPVVEAQAGEKCSDQVRCAKPLSCCNWDASAGEAAAEGHCGEMCMFGGPSIVDPEPPTCSDRCESNPCCECEDGYEMMLDCPPPPICPSTNQPPPVISGTCCRYEACLPTRPERVMPPPPSPAPQPGLSAPPHGALCLRYCPEMLYECPPPGDGCSEGEAPIDECGCKTGCPPMNCTTSPGRPVVGKSCETWAPCDCSRLACTSALATGRMLSLPYPPQVHLQREPHLLQRAALREGMPHARRQASRVEATDVLSARLPRYAV